MINIFIISFFALSYKNPSGFKLHNIFYILLYTMNTEQLFKDFNFNPDNLRGMLSNINDTINKNIIINYDEIPEEKKPGYMKLYKSPYISLPTLDINIENQPCGDGLKKKILKDIHDEKKN